MNTLKNTIDINLTQRTKIADVDLEKTAFGSVLTDHMLVVEYSDGEWVTPRIEPVHEFSLSPMALCLHYGQTVFEGMKAYRRSDGNISIFRLEKHFDRFNRSLERMCMPAVPEEIFCEGLIKLVELEQSWLSQQPGDSLYLRPFMIATEPKLGVKISEDYIFAVICAPAGSYFTGNVKVKVERHYTRAVQGGAGYAKNGGNYGAALFPTRLARAEGFDQVLWTDAKEHRFIEESGVMNVMAILNGRLVTPPLNGAILDGVTRDSVLTLAGDNGIQVEERPISVEELEQALINNPLTEVFGVGTAAVITPVELINIDGKSYFPNVSPSAASLKFRDDLQAIRSGNVSDRYNWNTKIVCSS